MVMPTHWLMGYFYPRPPRGGRPVGLFHLLGHPPISIHALREEGDTTHEEGTSDETHFYPRPPRGGRHNSFTQNALQADISIHALREEGDR